ncbi:hypothetical protein DH2020_025636 [Rehmannia glutinosa]|uniref:Uncharacterized protein n=1 Tax=Rehmannia glutinosa TaxID=99300 RepID=A0ABR0W1U9_REHGL
MKLKINKACDLSSISVLPPHSRRSSTVSSGLESSSIYGRSQTASQLRPQQTHQSQPTLSQGVSSQHGFFSQFSQNSQDEILTNEVKLGSQERENSGRRSSCLPPISYARDESQMMVSRSSNNLMRKWSGQEFKCQVSEELEHRVGMIETSLSRLGMVLDSVQSDIIQVNKATKEVALEMKAVRQKLIVDDALQSMAVSCRSPPQEVQFPNNATRHLKEQPISLLPKVETGGWTSVKQERATSNVGNLKRSNQIKVSPNHLEWRVVIESDEETDEGFSCLLKEKGTGRNCTYPKESEEEKEKILQYHHYKLKAFKLDKKLQIHILFFFFFLASQDLEPGLASSSSIERYLHLSTTTQSEHIFLVTFDVKRFNRHIIDNSSVGGSSREKYGDLPDKLPFAYDLDGFLNYGYEWFRRGVFSL